MHESTTLGIVILVTALMFTASVASLIAKRLRFPYTILLVIIGLILSRASGMFESLHLLRDFKLTPEAVLFVFLPVLLFESAFNMDARRLLKNLAPIVMLAVPALLVSLSIVGGIVHWTLGLPLGVALLFGALISATDPVAVVALFKEIGAPKRLNLLVEGESLFNDGTALVVFALLLGIIQSGTFTSVTLMKGVINFFVVALGGIATGVALGYIFSRLISKVYEDRFVEITLTTILAHSSFIAAEHLHVSGVMATVAAGLTMGSYGRLMVSPPVLEHMEAFWEYFAFICNSLIFLLVGLSIEAGSLVENYKAILIAAVAVLLGRVVAVYSTLPVVERLFKRVEHVSMAFRGVIAWGGLRGALAIVMALSIPQDMPERDFLLTLTLGVVLFSLIINGLSIRKLMSLLGLDRYSITENLERAQAMLNVKKTTHDSLMAFAQNKELNVGSAMRAALEYERDVEQIEIELMDLRALLPEAGESDVAMSHCLSYEKKQYIKLFEEGLLNEDKLRDMLTAIQRQLDRLKEGSSIYMPGRPPLLPRLEAMLEKLPLLRPIMSRLKTSRLAATYEVERARAVVGSEVLAEIDRMRSMGTLSDSAFEIAHSLYSSLHNKAHERLDEINAGYPEYVEKADYGILYRFSLGRELKKYRELHEAGAIPDKIFSEIETFLRRRVRSMKMRPVSELRLPPASLLKNVPFFSALPMDAIDGLASHCSARSFLRGENVVNEGEEGDSLFIIGRGAVDIFYSDAEGREVRITRLGAGEFFGETALLHPQPRTATVRAATPCTLLELSRQSLMPVMKQHPELKDVLESAYRRRVLSTLLGDAQTPVTISPEIQEVLASEMRSVAYKTGQTMTLEGKPAERMFIIKSGRASMRREGEEVALLGPGDSYIEHNLKYTATLAALQIVEAYTLEMERLRNLK